MDECLRRGSSRQEQESRHCHSAFREGRRKGNLWGRNEGERGVRARRETNRNSRHIWMFPKWERKTCILSVFCMRIPCSRSKMTFLMFFGSSQANFTAASFSHSIIFCPAEEEDYKAQIFMQVSSSHLLLRRDAPQSRIRHLPCPELSSGMLYS